MVFLVEHCAFIVHFLFLVTGMGDLVEVPVSWAGARIMEKEVS